MGQRPPLQFSGQVLGKLDREIGKMILILRAPSTKLMRNTRLRWIIFCTLAAVVSCQAPSSGWNGAWKLNPSKGNARGPVFTISISADGEYRYYDAAVGTASFTFRCDGKYRPMGRNFTEACVKSTATTLDLIRKENGVKMNADHWELSAGERIFTSTVTTFRPGGPVITSQAVSARMSGFNGFSGQWRDTSYLQRYADMAISLSSQILHIGYPTAGQYVDARIDGTDAVMRGPNAPEGATYSVRSAGRREFLILTKQNGKTLTQGSLELSDDGRIITYSWWSPSRPTKKSTLVYEKQ